MPSRLTRKSISLTDDDLDLIDSLRASPAGLAAIGDLSPERITVDSSEARVLHAVLGVGLRALRERIHEASYAAESEARRATAAERRRDSRRRLPAWADEPSDVG